VLFISFDESATQIVSNMRAIGIDLRQHVESRHLTIESLLSSGQSPEAYFIRIRKLLERELPAALVIDPISSLQKAQYPFSQMISECLLDEAKSRGITVFCTSLLDHATGTAEFSASHISTVADTWLHLSYVAHEGERNRALTIVKSRGTDHSNQVRELVLSGAGIGLVDVYTAEGAVLMGSARAQKEAEIARQHMAADLQIRQSRLRLERELEQMQEQLRTAQLELKWKEQEADMLQLADAQRLEARRIGLRQRRGLRRSDEEAYEGLPGEGELVKGPA
jgi:circadian clock protein KaiC